MTEDMETSSLMETETEVAEDFRRILLKINQRHQIL